MNRITRLRVLAVVCLLLLSALTIQQQPVGKSSEETTALLAQALGQLDLALEQAVYAHIRFPLEDLKTHAHNVLNVLEGRSGPNYDPAYLEGDGVGVLSYVQKIRQTPEIQDATAETQVTLQRAFDNVSFSLEQAIAHTLNAIRETQLSAAQSEMRQALAFLSAAKGRENELLTAAGGLLIIKAKVSPETSTSNPNK
jgi:hypothetical protein